MGEFMRRREDPQQQAEADEPGESTEAPAGAAKPQPRPRLNPSLTASLTLSLTTSLTRCGQHARPSAACSTRSSDAADASNSASIRPRRIT